jgi:hypothetical protein
VPAPGVAMEPRTPQNFMLVPNLMIDLNQVVSKTQTAKTPKPQRV